MSNTYFKLKKSETIPPMPSIMGNEVYLGYTTDMDISLTAYDDKEPNMLQLTVNTLCSRDSNSGIGYITLNTEEQNKLIWGILERRGISGQTMRDIQDMLSKMAKLSQDGKLCGISSSGYEQSLICPTDSE